MKKLMVFFFLLFLTHLAIEAQEELDPVVQEAVNQTLKDLSQGEIAQVTRVLQMINEGYVTKVIFHAENEQLLELSEMLFKRVLQVRNCITITVMQEGVKALQKDLTKRIAQLEEELGTQKERQQVSVVEELDYSRQKRISGELEKISSV
jgi:hypothetical protein